MVMQVMNLAYNSKQVCRYQALDRDLGHTFVYAVRVPNVINLIRDEYFGVLCEDERKKALAFRFIEDRNSFITAHALLRTSLSSHFPISPRDWIFRKSQLGKPEQISLPNRAHFNLSRTREIVCCALSDFPIGIDIENFNALDNRNDYISILDPREAEDVRSLPKSEKCLRAVIYWTLKESFLKGTGEGISGLSNGFWFHVSNDKDIKLQNGHIPNHASKRWQFATLLIDRSHVISISVHPRNNEPILFTGLKAELFGASENVNINITKK